MNTIKGRVKAIKKWKEDYIIIVELESGELVLAVEDKIQYQVKTGEEVVGELVNGILHLNDFATKKDETYGAVAEMTTEKLVHLSKLIQQLVVEGHQIYLFDKKINDLDCSDSSILGFLTRSFWESSKEANEYVKNLKVSMEDTLADLEGETEEEKRESLIEISSDDLGAKDKVIDFTLAGNEENFTYIYPFVTYEREDFVLRWAVLWHFNHDSKDIEYICEDDLMTALSKFVEGLAKHFTSIKI